MQKFGAIRYVRDVTARWEGNTARLLEWTPRNSFAIEEEMTDELGRPIEEVFDVDVEEATAVLGIPVGFDEPAIGQLITIAKTGSVNKSFVLISKERPERAGQYLRMSVTLRNKQYVDYTVNTNA